MSFPGAAAQGCTVTVAVYDGARKLMPAGTEVLYTIRDGNQKTIIRDYHRSSQMSFTSLPFYNNFGDNYSVIAWADGHVQAGFTPVRVSPYTPQRVDLMLLRKDATYHFGGATWKIVQAKRPTLARVLAADATSGNAARDRYADHVEHRPAALACVLNVATALEQIHLRTGTPLDHVHRIVQDETMQQDRFFAYAGPELLELVREAVPFGVFDPQPGSGLLHPGATASFKQTQFGEANVQITFHEADRCVIGAVDCCKVEFDIDYYQDKGAHALLEVLYNSTTGSLTDPRQVYLLRWIAGRRAGVPEFDPLYTVV
jgi:prepilin-type processing-associated H-X9-DG protein